jgi:GT2 family glycosyltransferase
MPLPARPTVSFVIATHNRGAVLLDCLRKTIDVALPALGAGRFSIAVVDNASTDDTAAGMARLAAREPALRFIQLEKNCGPVAKNAALEGSAADLIVLMDDDAYPLPGALARMVQHFQEDPHLGAAVFDVTLPSGAREASAYPDVFIGAGTALRGRALREVAAVAKDRPGRGFLPADFFMQAEEYDLSFRFLARGWRVQRFWDMPLMHLKTPGARIGTRTTRLDVRNNLWLLARYVPQPLARQLAADWLARYWSMAAGRDAQAGGASHKAAFLRGAAEGFSCWNRQHAAGRSLLNGDTLEQIFKFNAIARKLARACREHSIRRIAFGDWGKNILPFARAAADLGIEVTGILDSRLASAGLEYRGIPVISEGAFDGNADAVVITALSRVHAERRAAELRRTLSLPVLDLFSVAQSARTHAS